MHLEGFYMFYGTVHLRSNLCKTSLM